MRKQIIALHVLKAHILRVYLLYEATYDEIALEFATKAKQINN